MQKATTWEPPAGKAWVWRSTERIAYTIERAAGGDWYPLGTIPVSSDRTDEDVREQTEGLLAQYRRNRPEATYRLVRSATVDTYEEIR